MKLIEEFKVFYKRNYPDDLELGVELFSIFGFLDIQIDTSKNIETLIKELILDNYNLYHQELQVDLEDYNKYKKLLISLARGDRRIHSISRRVNLNEVDLKILIKELIELDIINIEHSSEVPTIKDYPKQKLKKEIRAHRISDKLRFNDPFLRFWFFFIAPYEDLISVGNYKLFDQKYEELGNGFSSYVFELLSLSFLEQKYKSKKLSVSSYWDANVEIDVFARGSNSLYIGECKWTNHKIIKKELHKLEDKLEYLPFKVDKKIFFSKRGFSNEFKNLKDETIELYELEDFIELVK